MLIADSRRSWKSHGFSIATISMLEENAMKVLDQGVNPLFMDPDPDKAREFFRQKPRAMVDKRMTEKEVVEKFIPDGCYLGIGGFGANRIPTAVIHEILRARRKNLGFLGHTSTHDFELLCAGKCFNRLDAAYIVGLEARGLSPNARRYMESGEVKVTEWTNYSLAARLKAAAEGPLKGILAYTDEEVVSIALDLLARAADGSRVRSASSLWA